MTNVARRRVLQLFVALPAAGLVELRAEERRPPAPSAPPAPVGATIIALTSLGEVRFATTSDMWEVREHSIALTRGAFVIEATKDQTIYGLDVEFPGMPRLPLLRCGEHVTAGARATFNIGGLR